MRIFYDTEFLEDGNTIALISIGLVAEDGRELYLVNRDMPVRRIKKHTWLMDNVVPHLPKGHGDQRLTMPDRWLFHYGDRAVKPYERIGTEVAAFIQATPDPQLWAWYCAYDHVALAQLFGPMSDLPDGIPMRTNDLRQEAERLGNPALPEQPAGEHNALADARHNLTRARALDALAIGTSARLLDCGFCYEENGEEVHPHPECPLGGVGSEPDDEPADSDSDVLALISEIASRLTDATDEGEYHAASLIGDLANGRKTVEEAMSELADITFRHV